MFFICPQSIVEKYLEVGGRGRCRVSPRHDCKSGNPFVVKASEKTSCFVSRGNGQLLSSRFGSGLPGPSSTGSTKIQIGETDIRTYTTPVPGFASTLGLLPGLPFLYIVFSSDTPSFTLSNLTRASQLRK